MRAGQVVLQFDKTGSGDMAATDLSHRTLWGPTVDQIMADEQVAWDGIAEDFVTDALLWPLTDHQGTVRDVAVYDDVEEATIIVNHIDYSSFGQITWQSNPAVDFGYAYTGRLRDPNTGLQYHTYRWYDAATGVWTSEDPITFAAGDANLYRYCGNEPTYWVDPSGLAGGADDVPSEWTNVRCCFPWLAGLPDGVLDWEPNEPSQDAIDFVVGAYYTAFPRQEDRIDWAVSTRSILQPFLERLKAANEQLETEKWSLIGKPNRSLYTWVEWWWGSTEEPQGYDEGRDAVWREIVTLEAHLNGKPIYFPEEPASGDMAVDAILTLLGAQWTKAAMQAKLLRVAKESRCADDLVTHSIRSIGTADNSIQKAGRKAISGADEAGRALAPAPARAVDAWAQRHASITSRLQEHLQQAIKQAKLTPAQARDVMKNGRASTHWGTQIDTRFKELVQNDPLLRGDVAVSPRTLPKGSGAPDVIDLRSKRWWDVTSTADEFAKKPPKYGTQYGEGTPLLYGEP